MGIHLCQIVRLLSGNFVNLRDLISSDKINPEEAILPASSHRKDI